MLLTPPSPTVSARGLSGATAPSRYAGATTSGAPLTGTFAVGDFTIDESGDIWVCTVAGSPGTFVAVGSAMNAVTSVFTRTGAVVATTGDYTAAKVTNAADTSSASVQNFTGNLEAPKIGLGLSPVKYLDMSADFSAIEPIRMAHIGTTPKTWMMGPCVGVANGDFGIYDATDAHTIMHLAAADASAVFYKGVGLYGTTPPSSQPVAITKPSGAGSALASYGYTQAQADAIVTAVNKLIDALGASVGIGVTA